MANSSGSRPPFFVYVVESPSALDLYQHRSEGTLIAKVLFLDDMPCVVRTAINPVAFEAALRIGLPEAMRGYPGQLPILHLSAHGGKDGIQLSSGDVVRWVQLRNLTLPINNILNGRLLLCMSACEGYSACQMAMRPDDAPHPYFAFVGNFGSPTWSDTAVAYSAFYHRLSKEATVLDAVEAMKIASGDNNWKCETAQAAKQGFIEYLRSNVDLPAALQSLLQQAHAAEIPPGAKAFQGNVGQKASGTQRIE